MIRHWIFAAILANLVGFLYAPALVHLLRQWWEDPNYSHGFLIPLVSLYFVWERRERLARLIPRPSAAGLVLLSAGVALYLLGRVGAELFVTRISLLPILAGLIIYLLGREHLRALAFPLLYLLFMIPLPALVFNAVAFPLQLFAAQAATSSLQTLGVPVLREGNLISLANTTLEVAEACSGIRSLVTLLALATTYAYFTQSAAWRRTALVLSAIPIAILSNAARVTGTGVLAHVFGDDIARSFFHTFSGWLVFALAFLLLVSLGGLLSGIPRRPEAARPGPAGAPAGTDPSFGLVKKESGGA